MGQKLQSYDKNIYLFQKKCETTKFEKTNHIFFNNLPIFFPVKSKTTNKILIKHLTNSILLQNVLKMNKNQYYLNFNKAILEKSLSIYPELKINVKNVFFKKDSEFKASINNLEYDFNDTEFIDFIMESEEYQKMEIKNIRTKRYVNKKKKNLQDSNSQASSEDNNNTNKSDETSIRNTSASGKSLPTAEKPQKKEKSVLINDLIENTKFLDYKKIDSDEILKKYANSFIYSNGFIVAKDYKTKCDILKSSVGIFGLHILGRRNIYLYDADFLHFLTIKNKTEKELTYKQLTKLLNNELKLNNFSGPLLEIPDNKSHIDIADELFIPNSKINIRFNNFKYFYEAMHIFESNLSRLVKMIDCKYL